MRSTLWSLVALVAFALPAGAQDVVRVGDAEIRFGGRLHIQYEQGSALDAEPGRVFARRARLKAEVKWGDAFEARLQPDFAGGEPELEDAWVALRPWPALRVSMGQFNRTLEIFELASSNDLPIIERDARVGGGPSCAGIDGVCSLSNLLGELDFVGRDQGLRVEWDLGDGLVVSSTLTNGPGANRADENRAKSLSVRTEFSPRDGLAVGVFYGLHDYLVDAESSDPDTRYAEAIGVDVVAGAWRDGPRFQGGFAWGDNWRAGEDARFRGVHLLGSWYLPLRGEGVFAALEPLLRLGWADGEVGAEGPGRGFVVTPGVAAYVQGRNRVALNLDVVDPTVGAVRWSLKLQSYAVF